VHRLSGQDASFLYTETPTVLMHTLKIQVFESPFGDSDYELLHSWLEAALHTVPMLRQRVMFVPANLHHPVMVDDPDFDLESHIYRAALPSPGGKAEFDQMISQILCHRLDRQRPLWELWALTGLEGGRVAIVHKIHHCLADGAATVRYLARVFEHHAKYPGSDKLAPTAWQPHPLPSGRQLVWDALKDHLQRDIRRLPTFLAELWHATGNLIRFNREVGSPTVERLSHPPPRTRFNHALSARRNFTTRQLDLEEVKLLGKRLGGTINDMVLALVAEAVRNYLLYHDDLPKEPLCVSVPVSADEAGTVRVSGNRTNYFPSCLWTNIEDPVERFRAIQHSTTVGKRELEALGKDTFLGVMHYLPPFFSIWKSHRKQRLRIADRLDYRPLTNLIISNVPGPRETQRGNYGTLVDLYSMGPLVEGCGLNITAWSYAGNLNISIMACKKAIPDLDQVADGLLQALDRLHACAPKGDLPEHD
jgi:diacylglycerol O-acyltransferase / wax synthase